LLYPQEWGLTSLNHPCDENTPQRSLRLCAHIRMTLPEATLTRRWSAKCMLQICHNIVQGLT